MTSAVRASSRHCRVAPRLWYSRGAVTSIRTKSSDSTPWDDTVFSGARGGDEPPATESTAGGRYDPGLTLGEGGMGQVFDAFDRVLRRRVALKVLRPSLAQSSPERDAFVREARLTSQLEHPHIVPVHDLILEANADYVAFLMKRIEGRTLSTWLESLGSEGQVFEQVVEIMLKVCDGVAFAHARGVLHLDLKPDNVMLGDHGEVYVMDWGIALECEADPAGWLRPTPAQRGIRGSLGYMAPEQLDPQLDPDQRTDVHGLGAILYEILAGRAPYAPRAAADSAANRLDRAPPPPLSQLAAGRAIPPGLAATAERALRAERHDRFPSVAALKAELEAFRRGGGWFATQVFEPGAAIVEEGQEAKSAYVITEGRCQVRKRQRDREVVLREMGPGEVFGETALLTSGARTASVHAITLVRVLLVTQDALERELSSRHWLGALVRALAMRFSEADQDRASLREQLAEALERAK